MAFTFPARSNRQPQRLEMFQQLAARIPSHNPGLTDAVQKLVAGFKDLDETRARLSRDESSTAGARLVKIAKTARAKVAPLLDGLETALNGAGEAQAHLRGEIEKVYNPPGKSYETVLRHQEIRAHFRRMARGNALAALEAARKTGDEDTLVAIASCQPFLSGLPNEMHQHTRDHLVEVHAPA